ncbi:carboxylesterase/lipase family protein [Saccharopolyspora cebuensis]|uniref:Carboxylic ester hydrolase n=1 Tax=Saccharopolyspora cebuensis TaxID=418759 RepID=A0ABV4CPM8_9PSEU
MTARARREDAATTAPEVRTASGAVRGRWSGGVGVFLGIPFAAAPVGPRRFAAPQPVRPWDGVRAASEFGPPPPQPIGIPGGTGDDWLTVNVWSPDPGREAGLPVLVWIHGGAYLLGGSSQPGYDGARLARDGGVVVVTLNYRVGVEGFAQLDGAPPNRGLLDQVAALEWVRDNVRGFGGDPGRVTVFGESAGAGSAAALLAMPSAAGLFGRVIAQSVAGTFFSAPLAADVGAVLAAAAGRRPSATELAEVEPARLVAAGDAVAADLGSHEHRWGPVARTTTPFAPVVDGEVLPVAPWQALAAGAGRDVDLLVGHTRDEQRLFTWLDGRLGAVTEQEAATALRVFAPGPDGARRYREAHPDAGPERLDELVRSDWLFRMPSLHLAEAQLAGGGRAHLYELTWTAPAADGPRGACHGLDVPLVFGTAGADLGARLIGADFTPAAEELSAHVRAAWVAFAVGGDPGWPPYDLDDRPTQVLDVPPAVTGYPEETSRRIWRDHVFAPLPLLG